MKRKRVIAGVLAAAMAISGWMMPDAAVETVLAATAPVSANQGADWLGVNRTFTSYNANLMSVTGFAKGYVNDRTWAIGTDAYRVVTTEEEFLQALQDAHDVFDSQGNVTREGKVSVIEVAADLDLGWESLSEKAKSISGIGEYGWEMRATLTNPSIIANGISQLNITNTNGLTIFSKSGNTIHHAEWKLQGSASDIVIRNIQFDGMWMYPEDSDGDTKACGWTPIKLNGVKGCWIDHCTILMGYDGCMDSENGASNVTVSWNQYMMDAEDATQKDGMIYKTVSYMQKMYELGRLNEKGAYTTSIIKKGYKPEQLMKYLAYHHKFNLNGSGEQDFMDGEGLKDGNQRLSLTFAFDKIYNVGSRLPLLRGGTMQYINCVMDNSSHKAAASAIGKGSGASAISARNGANVGVDTCVYNEISSSIIGGYNETQTRGNLGNNDEDFATAFAGVKNHVLIVNSKTTCNGKSYTGSSWDSNGKNMFANGFYNDGSTIGNFKWFSRLQDEENYKRGQIPKDENGNYVSFKYTYDNGEDDAAFKTYRALPLEEVEPAVNAYTGAYKFSEDASFWLRTEYAASEKYELADRSKVKATDIRLSREHIQMDMDGLYQLDAFVVPSDAGEKEVTFTSSDEAVVEVLDSGLLYAKKSGKAVITVAAKDGSGVTKACEVTITVPVTGIEISAPSKYIYLGDDTTPAETMQLQTVITPSDATNTAVIWSSGNERVLSIDENGVLTPHSKGSVTIFCESVANPSVSATLRMTVKTGKNPNATPVPETPSPQPSESAVPPTPSPQPSESAVPETPSPQPSEPVLTETPVPVTYLYGDVNKDGTVKAGDALAILKYVVSLPTNAETEFDVNDDIAMVLANVDGEDGITARDALGVLRIVVRLDEQHIYNPAQ